MLCRLSGADYESEVFNLTSVAMGPSMNKQFIEGPFL
jgi:hypothetical protein